MFTPPHACKYPLILLATLIALFAPNPSAARQPAAGSALREAAPAGEVEAGVRLFQRGDFKGAIKALRAAVKKRPADEDRAWLYLGHAHMGRGDTKEARKAFDHLLAARPDSAAAHAGLAFVHLRTGRRRDAERAAARAVELDKTIVDAHFVLGLIRLEEGAWLKVMQEADEIIRLDPRSANAYYLKSQAALGLYNKAESLLSDEGRGAYSYHAETLREARESRPLRLKEAAESLDKYLQLNPRAPDAELQREQVATLRAYADGSTADDARRIFKSSELSTKAYILKKPDPGFTEDARRNGVTGVVRLRVVLAADGQVKHVLVVKGLSHGLTERSVRAARGIRFKPATYNGVPVAQYVILEYNFNIY